MRKLNLKGNEKGFTLIEVLIAVAFMMVMIGGILMAISTSSRVLAMANRKEMAKDIASGDMEYIRTLGYADSYSLPSSSTTPALPAEYSNFQVTDPQHPLDYNTIHATFLRTNEQQIDIVVRFNGNVIFTLTEFRTNY